MNTQRAVFSTKLDPREFFRRSELADDMTIADAERVLREAGDMGIEPDGDLIDFDLMLAGVTL